MSITNNESRQEVLIKRCLNLIALSSFNLYCSPTRWCPCSIHEQAKHISACLQTQTGHSMCSLTWFWRDSYAVSLTLELFLKEKTFQIVLGIQIFQNLIRSLTNFSSSMIYRPYLPLWQLVSTAVYGSVSRRMTVWHQLGWAHKLLENTGDLFCCLKHGF